MMLGDRAYLTPDELRALAEALGAASRHRDPHAAGVAALTRFFAEHFPVLCEVIGEVIRGSGHQRFHYWCDVAEMSGYANYHFTLDAPNAPPQAATRADREHTRSD